MKDFDVFGSNDGVNFNFVTNASLAEATGGAISAQNISFNTTSQFIRFDITSNHGSSDHTGLSEVKFNGSPAPVPIPAALWLFGTALMGLLGVRRKKV